MNIQKAVVAVVIVLMMSIPAFSHKSGGQATGRAEVRRFLRTWLVDGNIDSATGFLTDEAKVCTPSPETAEISLKAHEEAKAVLREGLRSIKETLGARISLADAIRPIGPSLGVKYKSTVKKDAPEFSVMEVPDSFLRDTTCGKVPTAATPAVIVAAFMFQVPEEQTEAMYFIFQKQNGKWRIVAFDRFKQ